MCPLPFVCLTSSIQPSSIALYSYYSLVSSSHPCLPVVSWSSPAPGPQAHVLPPFSWCSCAFFCRWSSTILSTCPAYFKHISSPIVSLAISVYAAPPSFHPSSFDQLFSLLQSASPMFSHTCSLWTLVFFGMAIVSRHNIWWISYIYTLHSNTAQPQTITIKFYVAMANTMYTSFPGWDPAGSLEHILFHPW